MSIRPEFSVRSAPHLPQYGHELTPPLSPGSSRRLRRDVFTRNLVRTPPDGADTIYPVFVLEGEGGAKAVASMPGVERLSLDQLLPVARNAWNSASR